MVTISFPDISSSHCWYDSATSPEVYLSKMVDSPKHSWGSSTPQESRLLHQSSLFSSVFWIRYAWNLQPFSGKAHNPKKVLEQPALTINFWFFFFNGINFWFWWNFKGFYFWYDFLFFLENYVNICKCFLVSSSLVIKMKECFIISKWRILYCLCYLLGYSIVKFVWLVC